MDAQLMMHVLGGEVKRADVREYGKTEVLIDKASSKYLKACQHLQSAG